MLFLKIFLTTLGSGPPTKLFAAYEPLMRTKIGYSSSRDLIRKGDVYLVRMILTPGKTPIFMAKMLDQWLTMVELAKMPYF